MTVRVTGAAARAAGRLRRAGAASRSPARPSSRLPEATLVVPEGWSGATDDTGTLVLERAA